MQGNGGYGPLHGAGVNIVFHIGVYFPVMCCAITPPFQRFCPKNSPCLVIGPPRTTLPITLAK